jgi:hypothetical protein
MNPFDKIAHPKRKPRPKRKRPPKKVRVVRVNNLERVLDRHESLWNDDEYDAGKDW